MASEAFSSAELRLGLMPRMSDRLTSGDSLEPAMPTGPGNLRMQWTPRLSSAYGWRGLGSLFRP